MNSAADSVAAYVLAKDGNRPHLLDAVLADDVELRMVVRTDAIAFPPASTGREALVDTLVRRFNQTYENIYTFCIGAPPEPDARSFSCRWLVAMSEKLNGAVRVGCGRYDWTFAAVDRRVTTLVVRIDAMETLPPQALGPVMGWASSLAYPWCVEQALVHAPPNMTRLDSVIHALRCADA